MSIKPRYHSGMARTSSVHNPVVFRGVRRVHLGKQVVRAVAHGRAGKDRSQLLEFGGKEKIQRIGARDVLAEPLERLKNGQDALTSGFRVVHESIETLKVVGVGRAAQSLKARVEELVNQLGPPTVAAH